MLVLAPAEGQPGAGQPEPLERRLARVDAEHAALVDAPRVVRPGPGRVQCDEAVPRSGAARVSERAPLSAHAHAPSRAVEPLCEVDEVGQARSGSDVGRVQRLQVVLQSRVGWEDDVDL